MGLMDLVGLKDLILFLGVVWGGLWLVGIRGIIFLTGAEGVVAVFNKSVLLSSLCAF
jgi:hypothetical protein